MVLLKSCVLVSNLPYDTQILKKNVNVHVFSILLFTVLYTFNVYYTFYLCILSVCVYMYVQYVYYTTCTGVLLKFEYYLFDLFHSSSSAIGYMVTVNIFFQDLQLYTGIFWACAITMYMYYMQYFQHDGSLILKLPWDK